MNAVPDPKISPPPWRLTEIHGKTGGYVVHDNDGKVIGRMGRLYDAHLAVEAANSHVALWSRIRCLEIALSMRNHNVQSLRHCLDEATGALEACLKILTSSPPPYPDATVYGREDAVVNGVRVSSLICMSRDVLRQLEEEQEEQ